MGSCIYPRGNRQTEFGEGQAASILRFDRESLVAKIIVLDPFLSRDVKPASSAGGTIVIILAGFPKISVSAVS